MPALPPVPGVLRHLLEWTIGSDTSVTTRVFFSYTGPAPTSAALASYAGTSFTAAAAQFPPLMQGGSALVGLNVVDLSSASGGEGSVSGAHGGTALGGPLPASACVLQNLLVARRYRGGKPRRYWPLGSDANISNPQTWSTAFTTSVASAIAAWISASFAAPPTGTTLQQQVNVSYYEGFASAQNPVTKRWHNYPTPRAVPVVDIITSGSVNPKIGSQRRRIGA